MNHESYTRQDEVQGSSDRSFGLVFSGFFGILAVLSYYSRLPFSIDQAELRQCPFFFSHPALAQHALALGLAIASLAFLLAALVFPKLLAPLNWVWTRFGLLLHRIVSPIVLGALFFVVFAPAGVLMRLFGFDPLRLRFDPSARSYWIERVPPGPAPDSLKNQF